MAYQLASASSQYLTISSVPVAAAPLTMCCWFNPTTVNTTMTLMYIGNAANTHRFFMSIRGTDALKAIQLSVLESGVGSTLTTSTIAASANTWQHAAAVITSTTSRTIYLNAGNSATTTSAALAPQNVDVFSIGARQATTFGQLMNGSIADVGVWDAALTVDEINSLYRGAACNQVRPQNLRFYAPLIRDLIDIKGGRTITNNNTATVSNHPRVYL